MSENKTQVEFIEVEGTDSQIITISGDDTQGYAQLAKLVMENREKLQRVNLGAGAWLTDLERRFSEVDGAAAAGVAFGAVAISAAAGLLLWNIFQQEEIETIKSRVDRNDERFEQLTRQLNNQEEALRRIKEKGLKFDQVI
jgi:proteasome assembly chaperone (PAC2) family protein